MRVALVSVVCGLALLTAGSVRAQTPPNGPQPPAPAPAAPAAPATPAESKEFAHGLFDMLPTQFEFGGRVSDEDGDPARFQRYQDLGDGALFTAARYTHDDPGGRWLFRAAADNVGWRDQRYFARYERTGRFTITGAWDEVPQFYSVDTKTPYLTTKSPLDLPDATQKAIQNGQGNLSSYIPISPQFDLRERRDIGAASFVATPTPQVDVKAAFTSTRHRGELPWGGSFGFSNDVEVALPYDSRTNDLTAGAEWNTGRRMFRVAYNGSWFNNLDGTLVWDSPLRLDDSTSAPGRGRMSLWPTNSAQTVSAAGFARFSHRTQLTGFASYGVWTNDQPLQPFTINSALPQIPLPRTTAEAEARVVSANVNLVSHPVTDWRFSARVREYNYDNRTPHADITQYVSYDTSVSTSTTGGPELYARSMLTADADATWSRLKPLAVTFGYTYNRGGYDFRIFEHTNENQLRVVADAVGTQWLTFRARYDYGQRTGTGLDEGLLVEIGEQPAMRHFDVADRTRNRFTGQVDVMPNDVWTFSASGGGGRDDYADSGFGLQNTEFRVTSLAADYHRPNGLGAGVSYNYERYTGLQRSRSASSGQENDPLRDWTADTKERVHYYSIYATPPRFGPNTEVRLSYDWSYSKGDYVYGIVPGGPLPPPSQLPRVYNKLQQLHADVRHRLTTHLALTGSYLYEPFRVYDFAFDPTVVNSIVQPSSLVLGYVYRPYTANSGVVGLKYWW